jgi:hypothetical protein
MWGGCECASVARCFVCVCGTRTTPGVGGPPGQSWPDLGRRGRWALPRAGPKWWAGEVTYARGARGYVSLPAPSRARPTPPQVLTKCNLPRNFLAPGVLEARTAQNPAKPVYVLNSALLHSRPQPTQAQADCPPGFNNDQTVGWAEMCVLGASGVWHQPPGRWRPSCFLWLHACGCGVAALLGAPTVKPRPSTSAAGVSAWHDGAAAGPQQERDDALSVAVACICGSGEVFYEHTPTSPPLLTVCPIV